MVQWLRLHTSTAGDVGPIPGWGTKILYATGHVQKIKKKENNVFKKNKWSEQNYNTIIMEDGGKNEKDV